jgi:hypothetical protein
VRPGLSPPPGAGGLFMTTNTARSKCRTIRLATIAAMQPRTIVRGEEECALGFG